jgi:hypothetical protein
VNVALNTARESGWDDFLLAVWAAADLYLLGRYLLGGICWAVSAGLCRPAAGGICWLYLLSMPQPKAETASIKPRPKAAPESRNGQHQATAEGRADTESRDRKPKQSAASRAAD